ncbi:MAG: BCD family MFS transporter [Betaproteobacteria bacterium]|nr:BCD family MFS transporter [Betaproteobacteria bacterium]
MPRTEADPGFGWLSIARLGLIQACLGGIVVLATSTLNRIMVVELALPAVLPGLLVAMHYAVQILRPRMGFGSDRSGRCTPWILGGMAVLACGGVLGAVAVTTMSTSLASGIALSVLAFLLIGVGVSASGTSVLVLLAKRVAPKRRAGAATMVWLMMIAGFAITAGIAGHLLDPYSEARLLAVATGVAVIALVMTALMLIGLERTARAPEAAGADPVVREGFRATLTKVWREPAARHFTVFVFVSMLAFSAQDLILEPFAGTVFGFSPGETTKLSGLQHSGILCGMLLVALAGSGRLFGRRLGSLKFWTVTGCIASGFALAGLVAAGILGPGWPLRANVFLLGAANGAFSIAAIASMMRLAGEGEGRREGTRMGLWGAAQALAFGGGGLLGTALSDIARLVIDDIAIAYALVFGLEALLFIVSARLASQIHEPAPTIPSQTPLPQQPLSQEAAHA